MPANKQVKFYATDSLYTAIIEAAGNRGLSNYLRALVEADLRQRGLAFERVAAHGDASRRHDPARQPKNNPAT